MIGVARRSWARCGGAMETAGEYNRTTDDCITLPELADSALTESFFR